MFKVCNLGRISLALLAAIVASVSAFSEEAPVLSDLPKYQTPLPYAGIRNWHVTQNLGPTGARGWLYGHSSHSRESREILVKSVEPGSPADGILRPYDIIVGAAVPPATPSFEWKTAPAVKPFDDDARLALSRAITWAETEQGRGELKLMRNRDGATETVIIKLPVLGAYRPTAPFDCPKSARIVENAAAFVGANMPAEGFSNLTGALNAMLLYATGDDRYLDHVRRSACRMSINHTITDAGHETWRWGYMNMYLCEYYLATGDTRVLPTIKGFCDVLAAGQCNPGTWGHSGVPDFIPPGYGSMNQSGLVCFISLILADQCGVEVDARALRNSIEFYGFYAGKGGIPYGDHEPHADATCNGKNGSAAVAFSLLGVKPAGQWFARLCSSANLASFEGGHTGNFFNQTWAPLGASLAGERNYKRFWSRFNSYRDLARRWDGSFVTQPLPNTREGDLGTGNYVRKGPMWATGGFTLSYLAGNQRLAILGRRDSVFGGNPPQELKPALRLYGQKQFEQSSKAAAAFASSGDARVSALARQLQSAAQRNLNSVKLTLADMHTTLESGDLYTLKWQLQAIDSILDKDNTGLQAFRAAVEDPANEKTLAAGELYDRSTSGLDCSGMHGFQIFVKSAQANSRSRGALQQMAANGPGGYRALAQAHLDAYPELRLTAETTLSAPASADADTTPWRLLPDGATPDTAWTSPAFDDSAWPSVALPSKATGGKAVRYLRRQFDGVDAAAVESLVLEYALKGSMQVYLNGTRIMDTKGGGWPDVISILLKPVTRKLLSPEANCLAVLLKPASGDEAFAMTLKASMTP